MVATREESFASSAAGVARGAILKGWFERVFTLGFAFALTPDAWRGDLSGRIPLLSHRKALIINTTLFDQKSYEAGLAAAMKTLIDEYSLRYPGVQSVEHVYFYAVYGADAATRRGYLERAYALGRDFERSETVHADAPRAPLQ